MLKKHSQLFEGLFSASDLITISFAWVISYWLRFQLGLFPIDKGVPPFADYFRMLIFVWLIWGFVFKRFGLYKPMRGVNRLRETLLVIRANTFGVLLLLVATYLFREKSAPFSRLVFVIFWFVSTVMAVSSRALVRDFLRRMRKRGYNLRYALIVGAGSLASDVAKRMTSNPEYGIELVGCLDSGTPQQRALKAANDRNFRVLNGTLNGSPQQAQLTPELKVVGSYRDLPRLLAAGGIDQVIVALPLSDHNRLEEIVESIGDSMVDVRIVPDFHRLVRLGSQVEEFDGLPVVSIASTPLSGFNRILKRAFDVVLGIFFLALSLPVMLITALLVKVTSKGPVFYSQERVGLDGQKFNIYKFRTMRADAEATGACFAVKGDTRVTPIGGILRKTSIDELPQLFNVICGHMSLVGPRPERPIFIEEFRKKFPGYMLRHKVQAGMTGWAQVHGWRGNTSIERRIQHDLYYIEHWSLGLDLKIIGMTLLHNFRQENAY